MVWGGMQTEFLPLQIASGILIAVFLLAVLRYASALWARGDTAFAGVIALPALLISLALIGAGAGMFEW